MMLPGAPPQGGGDQEQFATGLLAGAGLRELSQVLGLSKKRGAGSAGGAQPNAATLAAGNLGELDKILMLAKLQGMLGTPPAPGMAPGGGMPNPMMARPPMPGAMPGMPQPGMPPMPQAMPGGMPGAMPMARPPMPAGPMGAPMGAPAPAPAPGGGNSLPMALLQQMLSGARGVV